MALRIGGLASGIDTDSLVKEMMAVQKLPLDKLTQQKTWTEWQKDSYRSVNLAFDALQKLGSELRLQRTFNSYSSNSSAAGSATAETTANSVAGSYDVVVERLAESAKIHSANAIKTIADPLISAKSTDAIGVAGTITIKGSGLEAANITVAVAATDTYAAVAKKIQDETASKAATNTTPELRASFDDTTSRFFISTKEMGANQNFTLSFDNQELAKQIINKEDAATKKAGDFVTTFSTTNPASENFMQTAKDGEITFDGITVSNITTNKTTVNGLTINLVALGSSTITVKADPTAVFDKIKSFVEKYNETIADLEKKLVEKSYPDFQPLSADQKKDMTDNEIELWEEKARSGLLRNDPILKSAMQELRRSFMDPVQGIASGNIKLLSEIGINTGAWSEGGKLNIDEDKLKTALANQPDEVMALFTNNVNDKNVGVGGRVYESLNKVMKQLSEKAGSPTSLVDNSTISERLKQMDTEISNWQDRLAKIEDRYWKQFTAMEKALSQMNSQSTWMQQNMFGGA